jgi:AraC-like DNA-binding protein
MEHYSSDELMASANYEAPIGLDLSEQRPFDYAEFTIPVNRETEFHMHYAMELGLVIDGSMERIFPDERLVLRKGSIWITSLLEPHWWRVWEKPARIAVFHMLPEFVVSLRFQGAPGLRLMAPFTVPHADRPRTTKKNRQQFLDLAARLRTLPQNDLKSVRLRLLLEECLILLQEHWTPPPVKPQKGETFERLTAAVHLVFETPRYLTTTTAAKACGLSRNRFHDLFVQQMGISFSDFALRYRLSNAARELRQSRAVVKDIAGRWGFADVSHFHRLFTEIYRCSPKTYRLAPPGVPPPAASSQGAIIQ